MPDTETMPPLHAITDELYSLDPAEFVPRRDAWVKQARTLKQPDLAARIKALRRPSVSASYLNRAIRTPLQPLLDFLDLGVPMREAQAALSVSELTDFSAQRRVLEDRALKDLVSMLRAAGVAPTQTSIEEVRQTLTAALADPEAERVVRSGCLARSLSYAGFGQIDLENALAADPDTSSPRARGHLSVVPNPSPDELSDEPTDTSAEDARRERAERGLAAAEQAHRTARRAHEGAARSRDRARQAQAKAASARDQAEARRERAAAALAQARAALASAEEGLAQADAELEVLGEDVCAADQILDGAARDLQQAAATLEEARGSRDQDSSS